jgi:hypothetical protein
MKTNYCDITYKLCVIKVYLKKSIFDKSGV